MRRLAAVVALLVIVGLGWRLLRPVEAPPPLPTPAPTAVLAPDALAWAELSGALTAFDDVIQRDDLAYEALGEAIAPERMPDAHRLDDWRPFAGALSAVDAAMVRPGLSLPQELARDGMELVAARGLSAALCLRGWERASSGDLPGAVDDMLAAHALGARLVDASERVDAISVGNQAQLTALQELRELLDFARDDAAGARAKRGLLSAAPQPGATLRVLPAECRRQERAALLRYAHPGDWRALQTLGLWRTTRRLGLPPTLTDRAAHALFFDPSALVSAVRARCAALGGALRLAPRDRRSLREQDALESGHLRWLLDDRFAKRAVRSMAWLEDVAANEERVSAVRGALVLHIAAREHLGEADAPP